MGALQALSERAEILLVILIQTAGLGKLAVLVQQVMPEGPVVQITTINIITTLQ
jgi:hypothetical protein